MTSSTYVELERKYSDNYCRRNFCWPFLKFGKCDPNFSHQLAPCAVTVLEQSACLRAIKQIYEIVSAEVKSLVKHHNNQVYCLKCQTLFSIDMFSILFLKYKARVVDACLRVVSLEMFQNLIFFGENMQIKQLCYFFTPYILKSPEHFISFLSASFWLLHVNTS